MRLLPFIAAEKEIQMKQLLLYRVSEVDQDFVKKHTSSKRKVVVALAADYGNLGDVAITMAQCELLEAFFPERELLVLPISETFTKLKSLQKVLRTDDLITLVGGGNSGDQYPDIEFARQLLIKQFPNQKIISFPQTVDYEDQSKIKPDLKKYERHLQLALTVREQRSFDFYHRHFKRPVRLLPDVVLTLGEKFKAQTKQRNKILLCLRQDQERQVQLSDEAQEILSQKDQLVYQDTQVDVQHLPLNEGMSQVRQILQLFQQRQLIITDRLHGMIFACVTGTPCIALDNKNKKISGVYQAWLKGNAQIHVFETTPSALELATKVEQFYGQTYTPPRFKAYFEELLTPSQQLYQGS